MKLIIIEGGDRLGKNSLIEGICKSINYENVTIRHFGKPPKGMTPQEVLDFQFKCFDHEAHFIGKQYTLFENTKYKYFEETMIWNRSHLGEYVYSQMFRGGNAKELKDMLTAWEIVKLNVEGHRKLDIYLITLTADPDFFLSKEDGKSFSQNIEQKSKELELFKKAHEFSLIRNKLLLKVDTKGQFREKHDILNEVIQFINPKNGST